MPDPLIKTINIKNTQDEVFNLNAQMKIQPNLSFPCP